VTLLIAGTVRVPPGNLAGLKPHMQAMLEASRAEDGCLAYSYAEDVAEPGLIRVFEAWRDQAAIDAHFQAPHMARWRAAWPQFGVSERRLTLYEVAAERPL
jgi:quinol monooxygenase YgiN